MIDLNKAVEIEYQKYQGKPGRPKGRKEKYYRLSISVKEKQKEDIQKYADKHFYGNISTMMRAILKEHKIIDR